MNQTIKFTRQRYELREHVRIALIQTALNPDYAWKSAINMNPTTERKLYQEIKKGFSILNDHMMQPNLILMPELSVPHGYLNDLTILCRSIGAVIVAGLDFEVEKGRVSNRAVVLIPNSWPDKTRRATSVRKAYFGKTFFSQGERKLFGSFGYTGKPDPTTYILDAGPFGNIGVAICSDFFDIERFIIYRGRIHHLIVISLNRDTNSYYFLAEAISRLVYCNVIICNGGFYGDSLAFSPYKKDHMRTVYRHGGQKLFTTQVISLPVFDLDQAQRKIETREKFKSPPPNYRKF